MWCLLAYCRSDPAAPHPPHTIQSAASGQFIIYMGGLTELKSILGMKSRSEYLSGKNPPNPTSQPPS
jgi:hypothetical protein